MIKMRNDSQQGSSKQQQIDLNNVSSNKDGCKSGNNKSGNGSIRKIITNPNSNMLLNRSTNVGDFLTKKTSSQLYSASRMGHSVISNGDNEFVMLQRPTILLKQQEPTMIITKNDLKEIKDENLKPIKSLNKLNNGILTNLNHSTNMFNTSNAIVTVQQEQSVPIVSQVAKQVDSFINNYNVIESLNTKLNGQYKPMLNSVKLLDENLLWMDSLQEYLVEQNNEYLVVGILGKKGVGKSTLQSLLAGCTESNNFIFKHETINDLKELNNHKTNGIQAFVSCERTIFLDCQPILSSSMLDRSISIDKQQSKFNNAANASSNNSSSSSQSTILQGSSNDFKYYENLIEMQSIELTCFLLSVCNVVLVMEDWFSDLNLFRLLQSAEMLMPNLNNIINNSSNNSNNSNSSGNNSNSAITNGLLNTIQQSDEATSYSFQYPHLIYVLNKSNQINKLELSRMKSYIESIMKDSKLIYKGSISSSASNLIIDFKKRNCQKSTNDSNDEINFVQILNIKNKSNIGENKMFETYSGESKIEKSIKYLLRDILSVRRTTQIFQLNEKRWFNYAGKVWEAIKRSPLISEYYRLMT